MASKSKEQLAAEEVADNFVIPGKYAMSMTMFTMASGGKNVITVDQLKNLAMMPVQMFVLPMVQGQIAKAAENLRNDKKAPEGYADAVAKVGQTFVQNAIGNLDKLIKPLFSIVDLNDSGTISKREFFNLARILETVKSASAQGRGNIDKAGVAKELLDGVFDLLDSNGDAALQKAEIAKYIHRIFLAIGEVINVCVELVTSSISDDIFDTFALGFFTTMAKKAEEGKLPANVFDESGNVSYEKCAPFLAMADSFMSQAVTMAKADPSSAANFAAAKMYLDLEKQMMEDLASKADKDGNITKEVYLGMMDTSIAKTCDTMKKQFTALLSGLPPQMQPIAMMVSGFVDPAGIFKNVMMSKPCVYMSVIDAVFKNFGTNGKISVKAYQVLYQLVAAKIDERVKDDDTAGRMKAVFDLLDLDADGTISAKEAGKIGGGLFRVSFAALGMVLNFYLRFLSDPMLLTGLLAAAETLGGQFGAPVLGAMGLTAPKFPIKKVFLESVIAKLLGGGAGGGPNAAGANQASLSEDDMAKAVFAKIDADGDGLLTLEEFNSIEAGRVTDGQFKMLCDLSGIADDKVDFDTFAMQYANGVDIKADYTRAMMM